MELDQRTQTVAGQLAQQQRVTPGVVPTDRPMQGDGGLRASGGDVGQPGCDARKAAETRRCQALCPGGTTLIGVQGHQDSMPGFEFRRPDRRGERPTVDREGATALGPGEELAPIVRRGKDIHHAQNGPAFAHQADADRRAPRAAGESRGAVVGIDQPDVWRLVLGRTVFARQFFTHDAVIWKRLGKGSSDQAFRFGVGEGVAAGAARTARAVELFAEAIASGACRLGREFESKPVVHGCSW